MVFHLKKLEFTSLKDTLCQGCLNWPSGAGGEDLKNFVNILFAISQLSPSPLGNRWGPSYEEPSIP